MFSRQPFPRVLYLDRLYLQYTCLRLVLLEAGMETGQSRNSPRKPHIWGRDLAQSKDPLLLVGFPRTMLWTQGCRGKGGTLPSIERVIPLARHSRKA